MLSFAAPAAADEPAFDALAPSAPVVTASPASPDNSLAPSWEFTGSALETFECSLARGEALVGDWAPCESPATYDLSTQPDGDYTFAVRGRDADGTTGPATESQYTLDTSVPAVPTMVSLPDPVGANRSPRFEWNGGAGETFQCRVRAESDQPTDWSPCSSPHSIDLSGRPDGSYVFAVRGISETGVPGPLRLERYVLDTRAPAAPSITSEPPAIGDGRSASLGFEAEPGAQVECRLLRTGGSTRNWAPCASPFSYDFTGRPDGVYTLELRAIDAARNVSGTTTRGYVLDTTPPAAPGVDSPSVTPATRLQPSFAFAGEEGATYECRLDGPGGYASGWQACAQSAPYDLTGQPLGEYTFSVRGSDTAGNIGEAGTGTYQLVPNPRAVDLRGGPGRVGSTRKPRWTFETASGQRYQCTLDFGSLTIFPFATCGSPRTYNLSGRPDGTYRFTVRTTATNGTQLEPVSQEYELDVTAPPRPEVKTEPVSPAADHTPGWGFEGESGAALDCQISRGGETVVDWTSCTAPRRFDLEGARDGDYTVNVRARDAAGNASPTAASTYELDATPPAAPTVEAAPEDDEIDRSPTWAFSGAKGDRFTCSLKRDDEVVAAEESCDAEQTYNLTGADPGNYTFTVQAADRAGNKSPVREASYRLAAQPATKPDEGETPGGGNGGNGGSGSGGSGSGGSDIDRNGGGTGAPGATGDPAAGNGGRGPTTGRGDGGGATRDRDRDRNRNRSEARTGGTAAGDDAGTGAGDAAAPGAAGANAGGGDGDGSGGSASGGGDRDENAGGIGDAVTDALGGAVRDGAKAVTSDTGRVVFPLTLLLLLGGFLLVQGRIDRRDPKLAAAPIDGGPELEFAPPPTRR